MKRKTLNNRTRARKTKQKSPDQLLDTKSRRILFWKRENTNNYEPFYFFYSNFLYCFVLNVNFNLKSHIWALDTYFKYSCLFIYIYYYFFSLLYYFCFNFCSLPQIFIKILKLWFKFSIHLFYTLSYSLSLNYFGSVSLAFFLLNFVRVQFFVYASVIIGCFCLSTLSVFNFIILVYLQAFI
jgi:hypothetical protein